MQELRPPATLGEDNDILKVLQQLLTVSEASAPLFWTLDSFFFFASSFHNIIQTGWIFPSIKWHIALPSCVINFMDFSISCHDEPKFSNIIRLWLCISRHLMSVPITKIYHFLNLMASARGSFRLFQCGLSFLKSINSFVFKANFSFSLSGSFHGQNIASYIQWLVI